MTKELAKRHNHPCLYIDLETTNVNDAANNVRKWIDMKHMQVLNGAGPRASKDPKIYGIRVALLETIWSSQ